MTTIASNRIVEELLSEAEVGFLQEQLEEMFLSWVLHSDSPTASFRDDIVFTYRVIKNHLKMIEKLTMDHVELTMVTSTGSVTSSATGGKNPNPLKRGNNRESEIE